MAQQTTETARLLVVSRDSSLLRSVWSIAESNGWEIETAGSAWNAIERLQSGEAVQLLLLDLFKGEGDSLQVLRWMRRLQPSVPIVVICPAEDGAKKREATRLGAEEVVSGPVEQEQLESAIQRHLANAESLFHEVASEDVEQLGPESFFVSASPITHKLRAQAELLAEADVPVLILGEKGSGKHTVAELIHKHSVRSGFAFLRVNCADMPGDLLEQELLGMSPASARSDRSGLGKLERADKGTVFLDEIAEMPVALQVRLMQVLQKNLVVKSGSESGREEGKPVDVRIVAATSANIERALAEGKLRQDLYYRLSAFTVHVPSLRQRKSEIAVLLKHTMHRLARHYGLSAREFGPALLKACQQYSWPGNLEELESFVKRYLVAGDSALAFSDVGTALRNAGAGHTSSNSRRNSSDAVNVSEPSNPKSLKSLMHDLKWEAERNAIGTALQKTGWNRKAAARLLQVSYRTLLYKIEQYHMSSSESFLSPLSTGNFVLQGSASRGSGKE